jgi:hypothetical protein
MRLAAGEHRLRAVDAVSVESALEQRHQRAAEAAQSFQHRSAIERQARGVPVDFAIVRRILRGVVELGGKGAEGGQDESRRLRRRGWR